jgi:small subunit ribosomal protein S17
MPKKIFVGKVISDKRQKTITVLVERWKVHPKYKKRIRVRKKYHVHDPKEEAKVGDIVMIQESRPISKTKKWILLKIIKKAEENP